MKSGAHEIYFGVMTDDWVEKYGNADSISRRQSESSHFSNCEDLSEIIYRVNEHQGKATLVVNARYSERQLPRVFEILEQWESCGGHSVMVSDIEVLIWLNERHSKLEKHLSVMAGVFNSRSVAFFERFQISRIVLPRELSIYEMENLIKNAENKIEYEAIVMFQKCEFIDSFCYFYHPCFEKHGCQMEFFHCGQKVKHVDNQDFLTPFCAACSLRLLMKAGIRHFKIAGRGYPFELITKSVQMIRQTTENEFLDTSAIQQLYQSAFGHACSPKNCYYP